MQEQLPFHAEYKRGLSTRIRQATIAIWHTNHQEGANTKLGKRPVLGKATIVPEDRQKGIAQTNSDTSSKNHFVQNLTLFFRRAYSKVSHNLYSLVMCSRAMCSLVKSSLKMFMVLCLILVVIIPCMLQCAAAFTCCRPVRGGLHH